jgi:hypothetical protein
MPSARKPFRPPPGGMEDRLIVVHDLPDFAAGRPAALLELRQPRYGFRRQRGAAKKALPM